MLVFHSAIGAWKMGKAIDLQGQRFGRLSVLDKAPNKGLRRQWRCRCDCGSDAIVGAASLRDGSTTSCGCFHREQVSERFSTHGMSGTATYRVWKSMRERCYSPAHKNYADYGGRGIGICERWAQDYRNFFADMGERPAGKTIERLDVNGNYNPDNCVWADATVQSRNRRSARIVNVQGRDMCVSEASELYGLCARTVGHRLSQGWDVMAALQTPVRRKASRHPPWK